MKIDVKHLETPRSCRRKVQYHTIFDILWPFYLDNYKAYSTLAVIIQNCSCFMALFYLLVGSWHPLIQVPLLLCIGVGCLGFNLATLMAYRSKRLLHLLLINILVSNSIVFCGLLM